MVRRCRARTVKRKLLTDVDVSRSLEPDPAIDRIAPCHAVAARCTFWRVINVAAPCTEIRVLAVNVRNAAREHGRAEGRLDVFSEKRERIGRTIPRADSRV